MPLYDFHCPQCDTNVELLARHADQPACAACGTPLERLVTGIAPIGKSREIAKSMRASAARAGHTSNFSGR